MGQVVQARVLLNGKASRGEAHLESEFLAFRGDFKLTIPLKDISSLSAKNGQLVISYPGGKAIFDLGGRARVWAEKIKNPKSLIDKLGIKPDSKVVVIGIHDAEFLQQLTNRTKSIINKIAGDLDFIFYAAESLHDLAKLSQLKNYLKKNGAIWVVSQKGRDANIKDTDVIQAAKEQDLVDIKVVSFSTTHTAIKLVIPLSKR